MSTAVVSFKDRVEDVYSQAKVLFEEGMAWETFYAMVLGEGGIAKKQFASWEQYSEFAATEPFDEILKMVDELRSDTKRMNGESAVVTVRLPKALHESLREEAFQQRTSMNLLCVSKLLRPLAT